MLKKSKVITCKHCGQEIAASDKTCPHCGAKNKKPIFTKWWFWLIIAVIFIGAIGGGGSDSSNKEIQATTSTDATANNNPLMDCKVIETDVKSGSGSVIGKRAYVEFKQSDFEKLTEEQLAEFAHDVVEGADYNYFTIDFGNGKGVVFAGCMIDGASIGDIDDTGAITHSEKTLSVSSDGSVKIEVNDAEDTEVEETEVKETTKADDSVSTEFANALNKAELYADVMNMSKKAIYDQLTSEYGDKFPADAAQYAIDNMSADWNANALAKAKEYAETMLMSKEAIYDQLISEYGEQFTEEEAQYAVDNVEADWNANALAKAKEYQNSMSMSSSAIYDQLISEYGEQFTAEEAQYAVDNLK